MKPCLDSLAQTRHISAENCYDFAVTGVWVEQTLISMRVSKASLCSPGESCFDLTGRFLLHPLDDNGQRLSAADAETG